MAQPKKTVLLVDDQEYIHKALQRSLRGDPYELLHAYDAAEAAGLLETRPDVDAIICDHCMPGTPGLEFLVSMRAAYPDVKTILLTALADIEQVTDAIEQGAVHCYMTKPWQREVLQAKLRELLFGEQEDAAEEAA